MLTIRPTLAPITALMLAGAPLPCGSDATLASAGTLSEGFQRVVAFPPYLPSGRTPLLRSSPLRTVLKTFAIYGSSPSNALLRKTRFRDGKMEAMNLVAALWVKKNAVRSPFRAAHHQGDAIMKSPSGETGDFLTAYGTTSVLVMPEKAKHVRTPKGISHIGPFTIGEVGFIRGIIRVGFALDFNVSFNGCTTGR